MPKTAITGETMIVDETDWLCAKVLFVDDDPNILSAYKRHLRKRYEIETAQNAEGGLEAVDNHGPFAVVVADMRMPDMNGIKFLAEVKERSADSVRIMLTGNADLQTAIDAVNESSIFRFLTKPCPPDVFARSLDEGLRQYRLIIIERELLTKTLVGSVKILTETLSLANPIAFSRAFHVTRYVKLIAMQLRLPNLWQYELASMLSQIGCVVLPPGVLEKLDIGLPLSRDENEMYFSHPLMGAALIAKIPRLKSIARIIEMQQKSFRDYPASEETDEDSMIALGGQILRVAIFLDRMLVNGYPYKTILSELSVHPNEYNARVVDALDAIKMGEVIGLDQDSDQDVHDDMIAQKNILTKDGVLLVAKGQRVSPIMQSVLERLGDFLQIEEGEHVPVDGDQMSPSEEGILERLLGFFHEKAGEHEDIDEYIEEIGLENLRSGMVLQKDIKTKDGDLLLAKGQQVSPLMQMVLKDVSSFFQTGSYKLGKLRQTDADQKVFAKRRGEIYESFRVFKPGEQREPEPEDVPSPPKKQKKEEERPGAEQIELDDLEPGMVIYEEIRTREEALLMTGGQEVTELNLQRLHNFSRTVGLQNEELYIVKEE